MCYEGSPSAFLFILSLLRLGLLHVANRLFSKLCWERPRSENASSRSCSTSTGRSYQNREQWCKPEWWTKAKGIYQWPAHYTQTSGCSFSHNTLSGLDADTSFCRQWPYSPSKRHGRPVYPYPCGVSFAVCGSYHRSEPGRPHC